MRCARLLSLLFLIVLSLIAPLPTSRAAIIASGDIDPSDPSTWTSGTSGYVGENSAGTLTVNGGSDLLSGNGGIGYNSGATGLVTVDGTGSTWSNSGLGIGYFGTGTLNITNGGSVSAGATSVAYGGGSTGIVTVSDSGSTWTSSSLSVGAFGVGTLNITNGGSVSVAGATSVGFRTFSTSTINFGTNGGTLTTQSLYASPTQLTGTGTVNACGLVSDFDLIFSSSHGLKQTTAFNSLSGQNVTVSLDMSTVANNGDLGAGYKGTGSLTIQDGIAVTSTNGYLGYNAGSTGTATVSGTGSNWTNSGSLDVGFYGNGTLRITNGGAVSNSYGCVGYYNSAGSGTVTLSGTGSTWVNSGYLIVGYWGTGAVSQTGGTNSVGGTLYLGYGSGSYGTYNLNAGVLAVQGLSGGPGTATFNFGSGTLQSGASFATSLPMTLTGAAKIDTQTYSAHAPVPSRAPVR